MPRIIPYQLLKCLKVLLNDKGGILSASEVKRIAGLMTKYSKKLVSKCIYVQILKCTKTELLGEFMGVGGWSLVYTWLNDGIRTMNWPLVQEILELLLLCPVDVHRLKINSAPKLVKGLCKDGGNEGVRILAKRLVEQWLKIVTENSAVANTAASDSQQQIGGTPSIAIKTTSVNERVEMENQNLESVDSNLRTESKGGLSETLASPKTDEKGLVYKIVVGKNGKSTLAKVGKTKADVLDESDVIEEEDSQSVKDDKEEIPQTEFVAVQIDSSSVEKLENEFEINSEDSSSSVDNKEKSQAKMKSDKLKYDTKSDKTDRKTSTDSRDAKEKENKEKYDKEKKSSSSSSHKSSSHKHSSSKSSTSSSSNKSKSSSHRSSSDKHRNEKERSSSSSSSHKDKEKERKDGSSSSSKSSHKSSSSSSKDRHRDKEKEKSSSSLSNTKKDKEREKEAQAEKDKDTLAKITPTTLEKLAKIPKKPKDESQSDANKTTSITIPSKKASISIEIRRDSEKAKTVKTYNSQFRSHGLTEEAPKPPSRKGLQKPVGSSGLSLPSSLPSSLKRAAPPEKESSVEKKTKAELVSTSVSNEKPGSIKLIPPKKIQTLIETNIFSDALSAATGPKKPLKRKRPANATSQQKDGATPPTSPDAPKVAPLKFYQDTLEGKSEKSNEESALDKDGATEDTNDDKENTIVEDDDDIPLKKVKEDIEKQVERERKLTADNSVDSADDLKVEKIKIPGPGCGPDGPPGVLMLHRRKGPKKKLSWKPPEELEQIRFFEIDENERVNVTKTSFNDMKNLERFNERDALLIARHGFTQEDNMESQIPWKPLIEVDDVPMHPDGSGSTQRRIQADREAGTLRALYFSSSMIPDTPAEAEIEPHYAYDIPIIPLDDVTGNQDAINDYTSMPWPEPKISSKDDDVISMPNVPTGLNGITMDLFGNAPNNPNPYNNFMNVFPNGTNGSLNLQNTFAPMGLQMPQVVGPPNNWQGPPPTGNHLMNPFATNNMDLGHGNMVHGPNSNFMNQPFGPNSGQFMPNNPQFGMNGFNNGPNFNGPPPPPPLIPNLGSSSMMNNGPGMSRGNMRNNNNNSGGGNWRMGGLNFQDNNIGGNGNWRSAGPGPNRNNGGGGNNSGVCKAFVRGHCRNGKSCKYIHPKSKRI